MWTSYNVCVHAHVHPSWTYHARLSIYVNTCTVHSHEIRINDMDSGNTVSIFTSRKLYAHGLKQQAGQSKLCSLRHFRQTARPSLLKLVDGRFWNVPTWSGCWWILTSWRICSTGAHSKHAATCKSNFLGKFDLPADAGRLVCDWSAGERQRCDWCYDCLPVIQNTSGRTMNELLNIMPNRHIKCNTKCRDIRTCTSAW